MTTFDKPTVTVVDHGDRWTVFHPFEAGVDVFKRGGHLMSHIQRCQIHGYYNCSHAKAVARYVEATS